MAYKQTTWQFSNVEEPETPMFSEGLHTVKITGAVFNDETADGNLKNTYKLTVECIEDGPCNGAVAFLTYWLYDSKTGNQSKNTIGILCSLGRAIFGDEARGIPAPPDVKGAVCMADIKLKTNELGKTYARVYRFLPASEDFDIYSDIEQNYRRDVPAPKN